ncbi:hypothetical protein QZH41_008321, partial [Actinostola sp. cb2023]
IYRTFVTVNKKQVILQGKSFLAPHDSVVIFQSHEISSTTTSAPFFLERFNAMRANEGTYYIVVVEHLKLRKLVACGSLIVEQKFIHDTAVRGRIEDIVVDDSVRGQKIGKLIVETLVLLSEKLGCYKTSLECRDPLLSYYTKFGFVAEQQQNHLVKRFFH